MNSKMLEIIQGLAQAAANAYDGAHDERFALDGEERKVGLKREEGCPIMDERVNDGFKISFHGHQACIMYQSDILLKDVHSGNFESEISRMINEVKKYLQKEYKKITGNSVTLTKQGDPQIIVQSTSRVRSFVQAHQFFNVSGLKADPDAGGSENRTVEDAIKKFLSLKSDKKPSNVTRK
tara:strand:+ start:196 stop:735 length:540 start_codon:yes stop_codon:yes gene_type:complete